MGKYFLEPNNEGEKDGIETVTTAGKINIRGWVYP